MIDHINSTREGHIVTIEDPIEVLHEDKKCIVNQREIGIDTESYADALRHVVRQDPDVILIGEMRDHETVAAALTAAEIGNLVLSTLHTIDATETINRIIDFFPPYQQKQVRLMLAATLKGIISMRLIPSIQGGLVPAVEVLVMTGTVREYISDPDKTYMIRDAMEEGEYYGMQTFDQSLLHAVPRPEDHARRRDRDGAQRARLQDQDPAARHRSEHGGPERRLLASLAICRVPRSASSAADSAGQRADRVDDPVVDVRRPQYHEPLVELVGDAVRRGDHHREGERLARRADRRAAQGRAAHRARSTRRDAPPLEGCAREASIRVPTRP